MRSPLFLVQYPGNKAGAAYGTGYCDAQCPHDDKFINGEANIVGWAPDPNGDPNSGDGKYGTCCTEMDVWEANSMATAYTPHMCTVDGQYRVRVWGGRGSCSLLRAPPPLREG